MPLRTASKRLVPGLLILSWATCAQAAYRDSTINSAASGIPSCTVPAGVAANDIVIMAIDSDDGAAVFTQANWPTGFTLGENVAPGPDGGRVAWGWKRTTGADTGSYTMAGSTSNEWICAAWAFSARSTSNPPVGTSTNNTSSNASAVTATVPSVTALLGDDLLTLNLPDVTATGIFNAYTSRPSGYTTDETLENGFANLAGDHLENVSAGATGTKTYVFTLTSGASGWYAVHIRIPVAASCVPSLTLLGVGRCGN